MTTQQQPRPIQTVGVPRPAAPNYTGLFLEPALPDSPLEEEAQDDDTFSAAQS